MLELFQAMLWPILASLLLPPVLVIFGLQLAARNELLAALAVPQLAVLGGAAALLLSHTGAAAFGWAFAAAAVGVTVWTFAEGRGQGLPKDSAIASVYTIALAGAALLFHRSEQGSEELLRALLGGLLLANQTAVAQSALISLVLAAALILLRRPLLAPDRSPGWTWAGRLLLALAVANFIKTGGYLGTVSCLLIAPLGAILLFRGTAARIAAGSALAGGAGVLGIYGAYRMDVPAGATVTGAMAAGFLMILAFALGRRAFNRRGGKDAAG